MNFAKLGRCRQELLILLVLACITTPVFWMTNLDQQIAGLFYRPDGVTDWSWQQWWLWRNLFRYGDIFAIVLAVGALLVAISGYAVPKLLKWQKPATYILLVIALGPGLVVNLVFKDHWGRPRPVHISDFGGQHAYIPPLQIGHTRDKSFPCGHCSVGYMFFALYFLSRKRKLFYFSLTMLFALMMALARMSAGGHFLSDILWSGYLVFFVAWLVYYGWYARETA